LKALNVSLTGKIALAKYGGPFRGLKVKNAQDNGMIGVVIFTDPDGDGNVTVAKGVAAYPGQLHLIHSSV
jgi:N-acetylated-alpha-linked acidic dipeptidase